jgi:hypothetical protein
MILSLSSTLIPGLTQIFVCLIKGTWKWQVLFHTNTVYYVIPVMIMQTHTHIVKVVLRVVLLANDSFLCCTILFYSDRYLMQATVKWLVSWSWQNYKKDTRRSETKKCNEVQQAAQEITIIQSFLLSISFLSLQ